MSQKLGYTITVWGLSGSLSVVNKSSNEVARESARELISTLMHNGYSVNLNGIECGMNYDTGEITNRRTYETLIGV